MLKIVYFLLFLPWIPLISASLRSSSKSDIVDLISANDDYSKISFAADGWVEYTQKDMLEKSPAGDEALSAFVFARVTANMVEHEDHNYKDMRKAFRQKAASGMNYKFLMRIEDIRYDDEFDEVQIILHKEPNQDFNVISITISKEPFPY